MPGPVCAQTAALRMGYYYYVVIPGISNKYGDAVLVGSVHADGKMYAIKL